jgi:glucosyl-3-phosphoglycerate synthase
MISVIIPVVTPAASVSALIAFARFHPAVTQVIVVNAGTAGNISDIVAPSEVTVIPGTLSGKGSAMQDGLRAANNELILYLDGDLVGLREDLIKSLMEPLLSGRADFVKSKSSRTRSCALLPLVRTFFPELAQLDQSLDGVFAARRSLLQALPFEPDYGVHIGLLIDTALSGLQIVEVDAGNIDYDLQPLENLGDAAAQFMRALLTRAVRHSRLNAVSLQDLCDIHPQKAKELPTLLAQAKQPQRIALIDMDRVLLKTPLLAQFTRRLQDYSKWDNRSSPSNLRSSEEWEKIASLCHGVPREFLEKIARTLALRAGARETVSQLRSAGYRVGIISDGFYAISEIVRQRIMADFSVAHTMIFHQNAASGIIVPSPAMFHATGCPFHLFCRRNVLFHVCERMGTRPEDVLVVGSSIRDACLMQAAGSSVEFLPETADARDDRGSTLSATLLDSMSEIQKNTDCR